HSNWPALAAIQEPFDACLFVGDLVDYGTDPVPCVNWVRKHASVAVRGNHDHAVAQRIPVKKDNGLHRLAAATRPLHWKLLSPSQMKYLVRLPVTRRVTLDGKRFYLVHATPRDPFDEYLRDDKAEWSERLQAIDADFVLVGHTHLPYCLPLDRGTVINPGSVGQPRDGDPRCAYAIIENGRVEMRRVTYDITATLKQMRNSGIDEDTLALAEAVLKSGGRMESADLERWTKHVNALPETRDPTADQSSIDPSPLMTEPSVNDTEVLASLATNRADDQTEEFVLPPKPDDLADTVTLELPPAKIPHRE
ncbi:MAG TPA: metallophosphoesterase family protein, partial [Planctomycetaceae bacterium]|nr:metallophosphoesterase family protein [Planctomycetaceae bacterium]